MLIMCVCSASETSKTRSLLSRSVQTLLEAARTPLPDRWDATLDLPQVSPHGGHECLRTRRCGHMLLLPFPGVCSPQPAGPGPGLGSGCCCAPAGSRCRHPVSLSAQFSLLGHEERRSAALQ